MDSPGKLRIHSICWEHPDITVGELRRMPDRVIARVPNVGKKSIALIRDYFGPHQELDAASPADIPDVIKELREKIANLESRVVWLESDIH